MALIDLCRSHINCILKILISILISVQVINFWLIDYQVPSRSADPETDASITEEMILKTLWSKYDSTYVIDSRGEFRIIRNLVKSGSLSATIPSTTDPQYYPDASQLDSQIKPHYYPDVSLVTHCTSNHLHRLLELSRVWQGPISVAVFANEDSLTAAINTIAKLFTCHKTSFQNVSLHLVLSLVMDAGHMETSTIQMTSCSGLESFLERESHLSENYAVSKLPYPNNLLRNVAIDGCRSQYILTIDIDMIPSADLYQKFFNVIRSNLTEDSQFIAYVIPAFEIMQSVGIPVNKQDLIDLWKKNFVRPFYEEMCRKCQNQTDYYRWHSITNTTGLSVAYEAEWKDPWEPFYIISIHAPRYSDLFKQYGFNRISQSCELHVAGYKFFILDNAFLIHRGFKVSNGFHLSKSSEQKRNRIIFRQFKSDLKLRYPNSTLRC